MTDRLGVVCEEDNTFAVRSVFNTAAHLITDHTHGRIISLVLTTAIDTNTQTHRYTQTYRQTDTHTDRQTDTQTDRQTDRYRHKRLK